MSTVRYMAYLPFNFFAGNDPDRDKNEYSKDSGNERKYSSSDQDSNFR